MNLDEVIQQIRDEFGFRQAGFVLDSVDHAPGQPLVLKATFSQTISFGVDLRELDGKDEQAAKEFIADRIESTKLRMKSGDLWKAL